VIILSAVAWFKFYSYQKALGVLAINQDWAVAQGKPGCHCWLGAAVPQERAAHFT